ncbi:hypothetical protein HDV00_007362 [Rhizophlyctis rosea]|nr:hypothetical protein HDV00_007362 [Rhizophlyctis rosea]
MSIADSEDRKDEDTAEVKNGEKEDHHKYESDDWEVYVEEEEVDDGTVEENRGKSCDGDRERPIRKVTKELIEEDDAWYSYLNQRLRKAFTWNTRGKGRRAFEREMAEIGREGIRLVRQDKRRIAGETHFWAGHGYNQRTRAKKG